MNLCPICNGRVYLAYQKKGDTAATYIAVCYSKQRCRNITGRGDTAEAAVQDFAERTKTINPQNSQPQLI